MKRRGEQAALAVLRDVPGTRVNLWVVARCPLCGASHYHPAGTLRDNPKERLGEVAAPCHPGITYLLAEAPKPRKEDRKAARRQERRKGKRGVPDDDW